MEPAGSAEIDEGVIKVLLVEDDDRLARLTSTYLESHGLHVLRVADGPEGLAEGLRRQYDVVLLDLMLPRQDGWEVCRELRRRTSVPIIMVTARAEEPDRVMGLELGADDYVTKPFSSRELLARIRAVVRRDRRRVGPEPRLVRAGRLLLDAGTLTASVDGRSLALTAYEFKLLRVLAESAGRVLSREQLLDLAKGSADKVFDRSVDVHVSRIRQKLGDDARQAVMIKTIRGLGYMLVAEEMP